MLLVYRCNTFALFNTSMVNVSLLESTQYILWKQSLFFTQRIRTKAGAMRTLLLFILFIVLEVTCYRIFHSNYFSNVYSQTGNYNYCLIVKKPLKKAYNVACANMLYIAKYCWHFIVHDLKLNNLHVLYLSQIF